MEQMINHLKAKADYYRRHLSDNPECTVTAARLIEVKTILVTMESINE